MSHSVGNPRGEALRHPPHCTPPAHGVFTVFPLKTSGFSSSLETEPACEVAPPLSVFPSITSEAQSLPRDNQSGRRPDFPFRFRTGIGVGISAKPHAAATVR